MNITKYTYLLLAVLLSVISLPINAGQLYRFTDKDGGIVVSKSLPPYAAQNGYEILDDKSLRLIERVAPALTPEQISQQERQQAKEQAEQQEAKRLADIAAKEELERQKQQAIYDQTLLASYQSEQELLNMRDADLLYRQTQIERTTEYQTKNKQKLVELQQQAAEQELSGHKISANLNKSITTMQESIRINDVEIERLRLEEQQLLKRYEEELIRLKQLLSKMNN